MSTRPVLENEMEAPVSKSTRQQEEEEEPSSTSKSHIIKSSRQQVRMKTLSGLEAVSLSCEEVKKHYTLEPCEGCQLGCTRKEDQVHCPLCSTDKFKPTTKTKVLEHIVAAHCQDSKPSVTYKEFRMPICKLKNCGAAKGNHYHCRICQCLILNKAHVMDHVHNCYEQQQKGQTLNKNSEQKSNESKQPKTPAAVISQNSKEVECMKRKPVRRDAPPGLEAITLSSEEVKKHYALEPCKGCPFGCKGMKDQVHCPLCSPDKFKPTRKIKVLAHIETAHCQDHRPCVNYKGYKMTICRLRCGAARRSHYHCYLCHKVLTKKAHVMAHVSKCCEQQEDMQTSVSISEAYNSDEEQQKSLTSILNIKTEKVHTVRQKVKREVPSGLKAIPLCSEEVRKHYSLEPCKGCPLGCTGMKDQVHCPICPVVKFKPTRKMKVLAHIVSAHCQDHRPSITFKGNKMVICSECCGQAKRSHYHCCFCDRVLSKKSQVLAHVTRCLGDDSKRTAAFRKVKSEGKTKRKAVVRGYSTTITKPCPQCHKRYHKKYLKYHIQSIHNTSREAKASITAQHNHHSICIDANTGLYAVARALRGPQHPIHVMCRTEGSEQQVECSLTACQELLQIEWRSGNSAEYLCPHLQSVQFSQVSAVPCEVDLDQLLLAPGISESHAAQLRQLGHEVESQGSKLLVEVPGLPNASTRMRWFSVFTGARQFQWWCKFGRTVVIADMRMKRVTCQCKTWTCLHVSVVRWWLGLGVRDEGRVRAGRQRKVPKIPSVTMKTEVEAVPGGPSDEDAIKRTVEYLCGAKCIEASALLQKKFDPCALPETFSPSETECVYCQAPLGPLQLVTRRVKLLVRGTPPLLGSDSAVRICPACHMEYRYQEWHHGVYNYDNRIFLSLPLLLMIRSALSTNISISSVVGMLEGEMGGVSGGVVERAYLSFEAMVVHYYSFSCVRCGYHPKIVVFSTSKAAVFHYSEGEEDNDQLWGMAHETMMDADSFWSDVQKELIAQGVVQDGWPNPFKMVPSPYYWAPYLGPHTRASPLLHNTEGQKAQQAWNATELVSEDVMLQLLAGEKLEMVRRLCRKLGLETAGTKLELLNRIAVVPKFIFDNAYAATFTNSGGWVMALCPHGVTYAAKCLLRLETPRDSVDLLRSFKHVPTVTISEAADVLAQAANQPPSVPLFTPHEGRLVEATDHHIKAARSKNLIVSLPTLIQDRPLTRLRPDLHPITGLADRFCLFDWYHHTPLKCPEDVLRRATLLKELTGYANSQAAKQLYCSKLGHEMNHFSSQNAAHHLFCFRLVTHLHNERINQDEVERQSEKLSGVTLNDMGQLVKCDVVLMKPGEYNTQTVDTDTASGVIISDLSQLTNAVTTSSPQIKASVLNVKYQNGVRESEASKAEPYDVHSDTPAIYLDTTQSDVMLNAVSRLVSSDKEMVDSSDDTPVIITVG